LEKKGDILVIDDEVDILITLQDLLEEEGYKVDIEHNPEKAVQKAQENCYDLIISDLKMPKMSGEEVLKEIRKRNKISSFLIMTAYGTIDTAVSCIKEGAYHYITKPINFNDPTIWQIINEGVEKAKILKENEKLKSMLESSKNSSNVDFIITKNPKMLSLMEYVEKIAPFDFTVMILGESGVGKELFAKAIHKLSPRKDKPFLALNCATISPDIMESEFFGSKKGIYTGAVEDRKGIIEMADEGTVFLDEISELPLDLQAKFLRFLQEKEIRKIGELTPKKVDVRVIVASNKDLKKLVEEGKFRQDLYYRLEGLKIEIPPLRERKDDIPILVNHFISKFNQKYGTNIKGISQDALLCLVNYDWTGNVRQLENVVYQSCIHAKDIIERENLPPLDTSIEEQDFQFEYNKAKEMHNKKFAESYFRVLLSMTNGNITQAAKLAKIERQSLQKLLKKYNINPEDFRKGKK
jgi:DNA-binding NtrC family response regulator